MQNSSPIAVSGEHPSQMSLNTFMQHFGSLFEHSPWVASRAYESGIGPEQDTVAGLLISLREALEASSHAEKLGLLRAHPDLAGKAAMRNDLTADSTNEQASAGLDQCSAEELTRFHAHNAAYKEKFDFPFIMAVRGSNRHDILNAFETRLANDQSTEFTTALHEVNKIAELRLHAINAEH